MKNKRFRYTPDRIDDYMFRIGHEDDSDFLGYSLPRGDFRKGTVEHEDYDKDWKEYLRQKARQKRSVSPTGKNRLLDTVSQHKTTHKK